mmetsp:Transcript_33045/g.73596  ORF Transcript_33045/g.73596 Transcript_33045/m.73596 type:complete len:692 (+) Transcript_33045:73-2148(+)
MGVSRGCAVSQPNVSNMMLYLSQYGYDALEPTNWRTSPSSSSTRPTLALGVVGHGERDKHTFYDVQCSLQADDPNGCMQWVAQRRLAQLREGLHDVTKRELGKDYNPLFADAPFALRGGLCGTTGRLQKWLETLADCINKGEASPTLVTEVLQFLEAPAEPAAAKAALCAPAALRPESASARSSKFSAEEQEPAPAVRDAQMASKATPRLTFPPGTAALKQSGPGSTLTQRAASNAATPKQGCASNTPRQASPPKAATPRQSTASKASKAATPRQNATRAASPRQSAATTAASAEGDAPPQEPDSRSSSRSRSIEETRMCPRASCPPALFGSRIGSGAEDDLVIIPPDVDTMASPLGGIRAAASPLKRDAIQQPEMSAPLPAACSTDVVRRARSASEPRIWTSRSCRLNELISNGAGSDRGTPTAPAEIIVAYLAPFGYQALSEDVWAQSPELSSRRPVLDISVENNAKKGSSRVYEICTRLQMSDPRSLLEWQTEYKLFGIREEIHDLVKQELGAREYGQHFSKTPFAMSGGPPGTTARLQKWMETLAATINSGHASPALVAQVLLALNAPAQAEHEAATRAMSIERFASQEKACVRSSSRLRSSQQSARKDETPEDTGECSMTAAESYDSTFCDDQGERRSRGIRKLRMWFVKLKRKLTQGRRCQSAPRASGTTMPRASDMSATSASTV